MLLVYMRQFGVVHVDMLNIRTHLNREHRTTTTVLVVEAIYPHPAAVVNAVCRRYSLKNGVGIIETD